LQSNYVLVFNQFSYSNLNLVFSAELVGVWLLKGSAIAQ